MVGLGSLSSSTLQPETKGIQKEIFPSLGPTIKHKGQNGRPINHQSILWFRFRHLQLRDGNDRDEMP